MRKATLSLEAKSKIVTQYKGSGLSVREFSRQHSIPVSTLYGWFRQLSKQQPIRIAQVIPQKGQRKQRKISARPIKKGGSPGIRISLGSVQLKLEQDFDQSMLKSVLEVLCEINLDN
jgi:transposase